MSHAITLCFRLTGCISLALLLTEHTLYFTSSMISFQLMTVYIMERCLFSIINVLSSYHLFNVDQMQHSTLFTLEIKSFFSRKTMSFFHKSRKVQKQEYKANDTINIGLYKEIRSHTFCFIFSVS